jgi:hypothetical protein
MQNNITMKPLNQNKMYVDINTIINYWKGQKHEGDKGGNFNLDLYLQILKAKSNEIQQRENSQTN